VTDVEWNDNGKALERIATALEQLVLELAESNAAREQAQAPYRAVAPVSVAPVVPQGPFPPIGWTCPVHGTQRVVPAGVSKKTGRPYSAFLVCGESNCEQKPGIAPAVLQRTAPPSQLP
jgi:hypothetical protein